MKKFIVLFLFACIFSTQIFAKISFATSDLNSKDEVLFTVKQDMAGINPYKSLFSAKISDGQLSGYPVLLTCYPEQMELLKEGTVLQIRNRYGTGRYNTVKGTFEMVASATALPLNSLPVTPYAASPNGKYFCLLDKTNLSYGSLILKNAETGKYISLCDKSRQSFEKVPVKWSPDSSILIYEKDNNLYFCNPEAILRGVEMEEKYRKIGRGTIDSINWISERYLIYIDDYQVYQVNAKELYTLGLYSGILGQGKAIGRLPSQFNPATDKFFVNSRMSGLVLIQNNRLFSYLKFQPGSCDYMDVIYTRPYLDTTASLVDVYVFWNAQENPILWLEQLPYNGRKEKATVFKLTDKATKVLELDSSGKPFVSPDKRKVAFYQEDVLYVYDINTWQKTAELAGENIVSAVWGDNNILYVGGEKTVCKWNIYRNSPEIAVLSSAQAGYWDKGDGSIIAEVSTNLFYKLDKKTSVWSKVTMVKPEGSLQNGRYRVFCGTTPNPRFENALYVRNLGRKTTTKAMFKESVEKGAAPKKVALVFDAYDNADGLSKILQTLKKYKVKGTFFINGEFIRRYPSETKQIVLNGYTAGSMFFSQTDLVNNEFVVDEEFVRRGLARNEDEFYTCTGKELSLIWHAPYYSVDPKIIANGEKAGYSYMTSYHDVTDNPAEDKELKPEYVIQKYCESLKKTAGGIVPVCVGFSQGNRSEPLYNYLDLLICALVDAGFEFVSAEDLN